MSTAELDSAAESLLRDPQYLLKLYRRVAQCLGKCDRTTHVRSMSPAFVSMDSRYCARDRVQTTELWLLKGVLRQILPTKAFTDRELLILLTVLPLSDYGGTEVGEGGVVRVSPVALLLCLRQLCPLRSTMLYGILCAMDTRTRRPHASESSCGMELAAHIQGGDSTCVLDSAVLVDHLTQSHGLTLSEALFIIDYCSAKTPTVAGKVAVEAPYLYALLYLRPLPPEIHSRLLLAIFAEAVGDPSKEEHSGTLALIRELQQVPLEPLDVTSGAGVTCMCTDVDESMMGSGLTAPSFEKLCNRVRVGLTRENIHQLFGYLQGKEGGARGVLSVSTLMQEFLWNFAPVGESLFSIVLEAVRRYISKEKGLLGFLLLFLDLPEGDLSIVTFIAALRKSGVSDAVSDVEIEWLRFKARDRKQLVILLSGKCPANREALIKQLFGRISSRCSGTTGATTVTAKDVISAFHPENSEGALANGEEWLHVMSSCLPENVAYDSFLFFWNSISAACSDDSVFTMILWRCFNMHTRP
uniref:Uncharacterized protein n=1 Tax=Trypanosoma congolense (strain IL3000) TaxID=1068625 RepID=G0UY21_TRYCI|nr:conserved hypothetical protein [Trypanosoma congolense IL3000]